LLLHLTVILTVCAQDDFFDRLADSTLLLTKQNVQYDPGYYTITYPDGDVPADKGVCTMW
jgi:uncharacterized protein YijF (DUF1287 family)